MHVPSQLRAVLLPILAIFATAYAAAEDCAGPSSLMASKPTSESFVRLGKWFDARRKHGCAAEAYRSALKLNSDSARVLELLGSSLSSLGNLSAADSAFQQSIRRAPAVASSHLKRAQILEQLHRTDDAKSEWEAALRLAPTSVEALDGMSRHLIAEGNYGGAIALLRSAPHTAGSETLTLDLAQAYGKASRLEEAEALLKKMLAAHPSSFPLIYSLTAVLSNARFYTEAAAVSGKFAAAHPQNFDAQRLYLRALITGQDALRAGPVARQLLQSYPNDDYVLFANGWVELQAGHFANAKEYLQRSVALNADSSGAHFDLGVALAKINDAQGAKQEFDKVIALGNPPPEAHYELAKVLNSLGETEEAERHLALFREWKDTESRRDLTHSIAKKADQELAARNSEQAIKLYREAVETSPNDALLNYKLSVALDAAGDTAGERAALEKAIQIDPDLAVAHNQLGYLESGNGDPAAAEEHFREAVRAAPTFTDAWINLAATLGMQSKFSEAQSAVASALKLEPKNAQALQLKNDLAASREQQK
jgi:tetratricopeptide (TPR) repeat protein